MRRFLFPLLAVSLVVACRMKEPGRAASANAPASPVSPFSRDGRLSSQQIQSYLDVQEKVKAAQTPADGSSPRPGYDDVTAAKENGFDPAEYAWVKKTILEALNSEEGAREARLRQERSDRWNKAGLDFTKEEIQATLNAATDEASRKMYREMLANYDTMKAEQLKSIAEEDSPLVYNRKILKPFACHSAASAPIGGAAGSNDSRPPEPCLVMKYLE